MSYILDALRKADAQRESDPARGIHAQPARATMELGPRSAVSRPWFWAAAAAGFATLSATGWYLYRDAPASVAPPSGVAVAGTARPAASPPPPSPPALPPPPVVA